MSTKWIDGELPVGTCGFLVERSDATVSYRTFELRDRPPVANLSGEPRPRDWCGSYNDLTIRGQGVWRVVASLKHGRIEIEEVTDRDELTAYLDGCGFPDLLEACLPHDFLTIP